MQYRQGVEHKLRSTFLLSAGALDKSSRFRCRPTELRLTS